jgi:tRNA A-37 threonylcarbamoyl transferase component Bud32
MGPRGQPRAEPTTLGLPDRYRVRRHIASGGMASVWCAEDLVLGRTVAIKVLAERFAHDDIAMRRFKREARAAARASNHAHVVTIFDVGDLDPEEGAEDDPVRPFIVMEYLAGGTVADAIRVGAVRRQEAVRWMREAASALDHAHARGIVHRDIKPANFLLNRSRVLHVADFGIARLVSEETITSAGELFGTAAYLSPEQALGREATGATDRYALAVAAFELLAGERPFGAQHFAAQARQHIEAPPPSATERDRSLPPTIDPVLIRGMAKDPAERFETAAEFVNAVETALSGGIPVTAQTAKAARAGNRGRGRAGGTGSRAGQPAGSLPRSPAGHRRGGRLVALAALLVAIAGVGAVALAGLGGGPRRATSTAARTSKRVVATAPAQRGRTHGAAAPKATTPTAGTTNAATSPSAPPSAEQLQLTGHQQLLAGDYPTAITTLRKAVLTASKSSLTYAYGLYDLGLALLRSGDPAGAVPILEQRAKIPNQTSVVLQTLDQALRASGQTPATSTPAPPAQRSHGGRPGHDGKAPAGSGGAGLAPLHGRGNAGEHTNFVD